MILSNFSHPKKESHLIEVIEEGIDICVNDEHLLKAEYPISVTEE